MSDEIYIGDDKLDLYEDTILAETRQVNDVGDLTTRRVSYTNMIRAPFTANNDRIFQAARMVESSGSFPYQQNSVRVVRGGVQKISNGVLILRRTSKDYELYILSGAADFFSRLKGLKLNDLNLTALTQGWDVNALMNTTTGVIFPVMNWGDFDGTTMNANTNLPSVYYHTLINQIIADAGYLKAGNVFAKSKYLNMIVPYGKSDFSYDGSFVLPFQFSALVATNQVLVNPVLNTKINFGNVVKGSIYLAASRYTHSTNVTIKAHFYCTLNYTFAGGVGFTIQIRKNGATILAQDNGTGAGGTLVLDSRTLFPNGVVLQNTEYVEVITTTTSGTITITEGAFNNQPLLIPIDSSALGDTAFGKLLPDMTQLDLMKDFMVRFNLLPSESNGTISFKSIDEIIADVANADDWTSKRDVLIEEEMTFLPLSYAQSNYFKYSPADRDVNESLGIGNLTIPAGNNVEESKDLYTSPFSNTLTVPVVKIMCAQVKVFVTSTARTKFDNAPGLRVLLVRDKYSWENNVNGLGAYKVAYFEDPRQSMSMSWQQLLDEEWVLFRAALQQPKMPTRGYNLSVIDNASMDFFKPMFDGTSYYLKLKSQEFVPGRSTKVQLLKI